jgi:hypothetical protein
MLKKNAPTGTNSNRLKPWLDFYRPFDPTGTPANRPDGSQTSEETASLHPLNPLSLKGPRISAGAEGNQNLSHFRIPDELLSVLPPKPQEIDIVPIIPEYFLNAWFARYDSSNSLQCRGNGDGETPGLERNRQTGAWNATPYSCGRGCPSYELYLAQRGQNAQQRQKIKEQFQQEYQRPIALCTGLEVRLLFLVVGQDGKLYGPCDLRSHSIYFLNDAAAQVKVLLQMEAAGRIDLWRSVLTLHKQKQRVGLAQGPSRENYTVGLKVKYLSVPGLSVPAPVAEEMPIERFVLPELEAAVGSLTIRK